MTYLGLILFTVTFTVYKQCLVLHIVYLYGTRLKKNIFMAAVLMVCRAEFLILLNTLRN